MKTRTKLAAATVAGVVLATTGVTAAIASGDGRNGGNGGNDTVRSSPAVAPLVPATSEGVFVPVAPCRLVDTRRTGAGGKLASGKARAFYVRGTQHFLNQGGRPGGCAIPAGAFAVTLNVTVTGAAGAGTLTGYPTGTATPPTNFVNYWGDRTVTATPTLRLAATGVEPALTIKNVGKPAHLVVYVTGYYAPQLAAFVDTDGTLAFSSGRATAASHGSMGNYVVTFDRDVSRCSFVATPYAFNYALAVGPEPGSSNAVHVYIHDGGTPFAPHDTSFYIEAVC